MSRAAGLRVDAERGTFFPCPPDHSIDKERERRVSQKVCSWTSSWACSQVCILHLGKAEAQQVV